MSISRRKLSDISYLLPSMCVCVCVCVCVSLDTLYQYTLALDVTYLTESVTTIPDGEQVPCTMFFFKPLSYNIAPSVIPKSRVKAYCEGGAWVEPDTTSKHLVLTLFHIKEKIACWVSIP